MATLRVLGPLELWANDRQLDPGTRKQQTILAALLVDAGRPVPVETLIDRVWDEAPPAGVRNVVQTYVTRLRRVLAQANAADGGSIRVRYRAGTYVLEIDRNQVDLHRFRSLLAHARAAAHTDDQRAALLREAIGLWRGQPLSGLPGDWSAQIREGLTQQRLTAMLALVPIELRLGRAGVIIDDVRAMLNDHPLVEPLAAALMRALCLDGRQAEALDCYAKIRERLLEELGTDPGAELRQVHEEVLRGQLDYAPGTPAVVPASVVPAQLPLDVHGFTGRDDHLAQLDVIADAAVKQPTAMIISVVSGTAGVGKTALAVHWAHQVRGRFPDGQLYANLRGFDPGGSIMSPPEAVRGFLDALGVPPQRIPADLTAQAALYRSMLTGKRVLVVLDNARDANQIRPLLPGAPGCLVLVTSRDQLTSLVAAEGAHPIMLDVLTADEAWRLLITRLGRGRVAAEPDAVDEIITSCARLPLALAIAAARAVTRPGLPLAALAGELRTTRGGGLDGFTGGDLATDARAVFSWSLRTLSDGAARLFRLLSLHPGPDIATPAAASLFGVPPEKVRPLLAELVRGHLVVEHTSDRFAMHDLLRTYATELAHTLDNEADRRATVHRTLDHYLHSGHAAALLLNAHRDPITPAPPRPGVTHECPADAVQAMTWFTAQYPILLAAIAQAADGGFDTHSWQLAWTLWDFFNRQGHWHDWAVSQQIALQATRRQADASAQARAHRGLAQAYGRLGRYDDVTTHLRLALDLYREVGDQTGKAHTYFSLSWVCEQQGRPGEALGHAERALDLFRVGGHVAGQANALNAIGWRHAQLGNHEHALNYCGQALTLLQEIGDLYGQAATWDSLGFARHHLGHHHEATSCYRQALRLFHQIGDRYNEADALTHLGDTHHAAGDPGPARDAWHGALRILDELSHPDAAKVRAKLAYAGKPTTIRRPLNGSEPAALSRISRSS